MQPDSRYTSQTPLFKYNKGTRIRRMVAIGVAGVVIIAIIVTVAVVTRNKEDDRLEDSIIPGELPPPPSERGVYTQAAVASDAVPCAPIGKEILMENGTAVDAAIATLLCMGVYNAQSLGIGGGFFMVISNGTNGHISVVDARETAPANASADMYVRDWQKSFQGPLSVGVPGEIRGYEVAHKLHGRLPWKRLFEPAIHLAKDGFKVGLHLARSLHNQEKIVLNDPGLRAVFVDQKTGLVKKEGDLVQRPKLAETLRAIADNGPDEMYTGDVAKKMINDLKQMGGILTLEDLKQYTAKLRNATTTPLQNGIVLHTVPPPGGGGIMGLLMSIVNGYKWNSSALNPDNALVTYQRLVEAFKYSYGYRSILGDPDFFKLMSSLSSEELANSLRALIKDDQTFEPEHYQPKQMESDDHGTAHTSIIAQDGSAVSVTSTVNYWFGAGILSPSTGIILNNELDDFTFVKDPNDPNRIQPGKRPLSSMSPALLMNSTGHVIMAIGAAGGTRIISGTAMVIARTLWWGLDLKDAIDAPRLHHQLRPNVLEIENGFPKEYLDGLEKIGHKLKQRGAYGSVVVGIHRNNDDKLIANYDYRKGGSIDGF